MSDDRKSMIARRALTARLLYACLLAMLAVAGARLHAQTPVAASGREFYIALPSVDFAVGAHALRLGVTATNTATVTLELLEYGRIESVTIGAGGRWERVIPVDSIMLLEREYRAQRVVRIRATEPVTVTAVNDAKHLSDGWLALPTESLGFEYLAMSYPGVPRENTRGGVVAVIATDDDTQVRIIPSVLTRTGNDPGVQYSVTLDRGEIYQVIPMQPSLTDLSGTRIVADKPVAVISGHRGVPTDSVSAYNSILEQMVPLADWGRTFYVVKLPEQSRGRYRVLARSAGTDVTVNGLRIVTLGAGAVHEFLTDGAAMIEATQPVLLAQVGTRRPASVDPPQIDSDPSLAIINPVDSYAERFEWSTPTMAPRGLSPEKAIGWRHWAIITAPTAARASVRLDGAPVSFSIPHGDGRYWTALVEVQPGAHRVDAAAPVNVQISGDSQFDAYAMPAGMRLREPFRAAPLFARTCAAQLDTIIALANFGGEQIEVTDVTFRSGSTRLYPALPFLVPAGGSRQLGVRIALPGYGRFLDTAIITTTTSGARPLAVPVEVWRDSLAVEAVERTVVFAPVTASNPSRDTVVHLVNRGTGPVAIPSIGFTGPFTLVSPALPTTIGTGDTLAVTIRFAPAAPGLSRGSATVQLAPCGAPVAIELTGQRLRGPGVELRRVVVSEAGCGPDAVVETPVVVRSVGEEPLRFDSIEVRGPGAPAFSVVAPPAGTLVAPGDSIVATLRFAAPGPGTYTIQLRVWNGVSPGGYLLSDPIEARRVSIEPVLSASAIDFGTLGPCDAAMLDTVAITNRGTTPMRIERLRHATADFVVDGADGVELAPGASSRVLVRYEPRSRGAHADTLRIAITPCDTTLIVVLTGRRVVAALEPERDTLDLGTIAACDLPVERSVRLRNSGDVPMTIARASADGGFTLAGVDATTLAPGEETLARVVLAAGATPGSIEGALLVESEPCATRTTVVLRAVVATAALAIDGSLDFGRLARDVPVRRTVRLRNIGTATVRVDALALGPAVAGLRIVSPAPGFLLAPGTDSAVVVEYLSSAPASFTTTLRAHSSEPCDTGVEAIARGDYDVERSLRLAFPDTSGWVDSEVVIPLAVSRPIESDPRATVRAELRWDYTMLALDGARTPVAGGAIASLSVRTEGDERVAVVEYVGPIPESGVLVELVTRVLVGAAEHTPLRIAGVTVEGESGGAWSVQTRDGSFTTLGICSIGGGRFIRVEGRFLPRGIIPNPISDRARLELVGDASAHVVVTVLDATGRRVMTAFDGVLAGGRREIELDLGALPSGWYWVAAGGSGLRVEVGR